MKNSKLRKKNSLLKKFRKLCLENKLKISLFGTLLLMTVGYATINTTLGVDGLISLVKNDNFKVYFSNLKIDGIDLNSLISADKESFTFNTTHIKENGDSLISYEITNSSDQYDAEVNITCTPTSAENTSLYYDKSKKKIETQNKVEDEINVTTNNSSKNQPIFNYIKNQSKGKDTDQGINYDEISSSTNGEGVYETTNTDSGNPVYFFRGNVTNNNIIFAGFCWQIIRTTETGGVKLFYNGIPTNGKCSKPTGMGLGATPFNSVNNDNAYGGYMYGTNGSANYSLTHQNTHDSVLKTKIDNWYKTNILNKNAELLLEDTIWCNDRSIPSDTSNWSNNASTYTQHGYGTNRTLYAFALRGGSYAKVTSPTLKCANANDRFTVSTSTGNGALTYPVATITADEMIYAGATGGKYSSTLATSPNNTNYFLANTKGNVWMMTPVFYDTYVHGSVLYTNGALSTMWTNVARNIGDIGVRPAVSLKGDTEILSGTGTIDNPYTVEKTTTSSFTCKLNVTAIEKNEELEEKDLLGKEYCIGDECFNIIGYDKQNYTLLAKYNLYVGNIVETGSGTTVISKSDPLYGKQNPKAVGDKTSSKYGTVAFSANNSSNDYETSTVKPYVDEYVKYLNDTYGVNTTGRLITIEELQKLGCIVGESSKHGCDYPTYAKHEWLLNTTYWTSTKGSTNKSIYLVGGDGFFAEVTSINNATNRGVRPVIIVPVEKTPTSKIPESWQDNGIFKAYYEQAYDKLQTMTIEEKIGQLLIVRYKTSTLTDAVEKYNVGGTTFYAIDFANKTETEVKQMTSALQAKTKIPLITAVDEEGGSVVRVSSNKNLVAEPFKSPKELYDSGGLNAITQDTVNKSAILRNLGLNMNFAPVVDIADSTAYIYKRTLGQDAKTTGQYARAVVSASKNTGVSYSLKHFPGYGNNADTHTSSSVDETSMEELWNKHLVPFIEGIDEKAESVLISHNIVSAIDKDNPSSLSKKVHDLLFNDLKFTGIAITDDMDMKGASDVDNKYVKALLAGNNIILLSNYADAQTQILTSIQNGTITEEYISKLAFKVLAWKYYKGLL